MRALQYVFVVVMSIGFIQSTHAHHPTEGELSLEQLLLEAEANNLEVREAKRSLEASREVLRGSRAKFFPHLSLEGGPQSVQFDSEKYSGTSVYGKAELNLFRGGADQATLSQASSDIEIQEAKLAASRIELRSDVSKLYYELLYLLESISLSERALEMNAQQMRLANAKKASGLTSKADVIEFQMRQASLRSDLMSLQVERDHKYRQLNIVLGREDLTKSPGVKGHLFRDSDKLDFSALKESALKKNISVQEALAEGEKAASSVVIARAGFLPTVDIEGKYGKLGNEERVFDRSDNYSVAVKVKIPLFSGFETLSERRAASLGLESAESKLRLIRLKIEAEMRDLEVEFRTLTEKLDIEEQNLSLSEEYYNLTVDEYRRGIKNSPDMVEASERLLQARLRNLEYRKKFQVTKLKALEVAGVGTL